LSVTNNIPASLEQRLGHAQAEQRKRIEAMREASGRDSRIRVFGLPISEATIRTVLKVSGFYGRGCRNASELGQKDNFVRAPMPGNFEGFRILQLSDLHIDMNPAIVGRLAKMLPALHYDLCVFTGDYRGKSYGPHQSAIDEIRKIRPSLKGPIYGVLGDHDIIAMVPELENLGIRMLLNESIRIDRGADSIRLAGIDDAHGFHSDDIAKAVSEIPTSDFSILLSHTPEVYRQAEMAGFKLLLSGHTHGGQICLPGGYPVTLEAGIPRFMGAGPWRYKRMIGYTSRGTGSSVVPVRFNCPPEITLHHLHAIPSEGAVSDVQLEH